MEDPSPLPDYFRDLQSQSPPETVVAFIQANPGHPVIKPTRDALGGLSRPDHSSLTQQLLGTINDDVWKHQFFHAIELHIENHPLETAFIVVVIVMLCNPIFVPDLTPPNSTTKSIAEAWKLLPGGPESADRAFNILRRMGMVGASTAVARNLRLEERRAMLSAIQGQHSILSELRKFNLRDLFNKLIATATDPEFYRALFRAVINHIKEHPFQTAFIVVGLVLILNPVGLAGFGALGPVAGSAAAAWQATYGGYVVAGSVFSVLQMIGMVGAIAIPMSGVGVLGAALALPWLKRWFDETDMAATVIRWFDGIAGMPAAMVQWFKGMPAAMMQWFKDIDMAATMKTWWAGLTEGVKTWWEKLFGGSDHEHED